MTGLEAFKIVYNNFDYLISDVCIENDDVNICLKTIKEQLPTIKQALLKVQELEKENAELRQKAQESKKYLKWEDLIFSKEPTYTKATLNSIKVTLKSWKEYMKEWCVVDFNNAPCNNMVFVHHGYDDKTDTQTTIFDALGFERAEE